MPIRMNKPSESSFGINIEDTFDATDDHTVELVDMDEFQGVSKMDGKPYTSIVWKFVIYDADGIAFTNLIDGGAFESWQFSSMSLSEKSQARAWAAALLGKSALSDAECDKLAEAFDSALVGKRATASWKVDSDPKTGNKRLKIALLRPLRKSRTAAPARPAEEAATSATAATVDTYDGSRTERRRRARLPPKSVRVCTLSSRRCPTLKTPKTATRRSRACQRQVSAAGAERRPFSVGGSTSSSKTSPVAS